MTPEELLVETSKRPLEERWKYFKENSHKIADAAAREKVAFAIIAKEVIGTSMNQSTSFPTWAPLAGYIALAGTMIFFAGILIWLTQTGLPLPTQARFLLSAILASGVALAFAFLGGHAAATGNLPVPLLKDKPFAVSVTGGSAMFVIVFILSMNFI